MKKIIFAVVVIAGLVAAASFNVRVEVRQNAAHACAGYGC